MTQAEKDFEEYVERFAKSKGITPEEAKKYKATQEVKAYYEEVYKTNKTRAAE